jgi:hypothetical protein
MYAGNFSNALSTNAPLALLDLAGSIAAIALANKIARMTRAMMTRGQRYKEPVVLAA